MKLVNNRSYTYILPMLDWWEAKFLINMQLRGCFIGDVNYPDLDNHIFLLYKFTGARWFTAFEDTMHDCDYFVTSYDPDKTHVMFVYEVPKHHKDSYTKIRQSKYSQISEILKKRIVAFHGEENTKKVQAVMYKHESMYKDWENRLNDGLPSNMHVKIPRDQEATTSLNMVEEVYNDRVKVFDALESGRDSFLSQQEKEEIDE